MTHAITEATFPARIKALASRIKDNWTLCEFMGRCEREYMVAETIHAAAINLDSKGDAFSYRGGGVFSSSPHADNGSAYSYLVRNGYFAESERDGRPVIIPTAKLVESLERFLDREEAPK